MRESKTQIAVIILTVNQREKTTRCLNSFRMVKTPPFKIILWDNGSQDGTEEFIRESYPEVIVHHHPENLGAAAGRNSAVELAIELLDPDFLLFIDNDMTVTPHFLKYLYLPFVDYPGLGQTTGKIKVPGNTRVINDAGGCKIQFHLGRTSPVGYGEIDTGQYDKPGQCVPGGFSLVTTEVFHKVGGFDTAFDPYGYEDLDFSLRISKAGYHALYVPEALTFHEVTQTFEGGKYTEKYANRKAKNWMLFLSRHASPWQKLGFYLIGAPYLTANVIFREGRKGNWKAIRGLWTGIVKPKMPKVIK
jgi:GT2 family glycosyltransferase